MRGEVLLQVPSLQQDNVRNARGEVGRSKDFKDVQGKSGIKNWKLASEKVIKRNARYISRMKASAADGGRADGAVVQSSEAV